MDLNKPRKCSKCGRGGWIVVEKKRRIGNDFALHISLVLKCMFCGKLQKRVERY